MLIRSGTLQPLRSAPVQRPRDAADPCQPGYFERLNGSLLVERVGLEPTTGPLMLVYLTDVRGERVVIIQVNWIS